MEVTQCRIVLFTPGDPNDVSAVESPAIVTRVNEGGTVDLTVFPPGANPYPVSNVEESASGGSENAKWRWPQAAPSGSSPETPAEPEPETPSDPDPAPPAAEEPASTDDGGSPETPAEGETPTTSAASEKPLYKVSGDELPAGFTLSGLETPEGATLYHYEGDTAGQQHTFDLASDSNVVLYAEADDNDQPVKPVEEATA